MQKHKHSKHKKTLICLRNHVILGDPTVDCHNQTCSVVQLNLFAKGSLGGSKSEHIKKTLFSDLRNIYK